MNDSTAFFDVGERVPSPRKDTSAAGAVEAVIDEASPALHLPTVRSRWEEIAGTALKERASYKTSWQTCWKPNTSSTRNARRPGWSGKRTSPAPTRSNSAAPSPYTDALTFSVRTSSAISSWTRPERSCCSRCSPMARNDHRHRLERSVLGAEAGLHRPAALRGNRGRGHLQRTHRRDRHRQLPPCPDPGEATPPNLTDRRVRDQPLIPDPCRGGVSRPGRRRRRGSHASSMSAACGFAAIVVSHSAGAHYWPAVRRLHLVRVSKPESSQ